ncbi:hypothetical protein WICMUC_003140 [Wickerhamomyces mucosus]|uniref:Methylthioribulose-1-phosphate dehydratase n=1 Tax=Wickerhamomyces mucosus TaxID=1378264 RepID=A0A9P8PNT2_9ASCO|nr:hypothetical protein WICMUC_003140 [Wickerhamomyces mucosus]
MACNCTGGAEKQQQALSTSSPSSASPEDLLVLSSDPLHPANVICELCQLFYDNEWVTGTGGGISIKDGTNVYIAPSGVQKERMKPTDLFVLNYDDSVVLRRPLNFKPSACTPLFFTAYKLQNASACIHTHSQNAVMISLLYSNEFKIANIEQIKAIPKGYEPGYLSYFDTLTIPIIENTAHEEELEVPMHEIIKKYPHTRALIVRRHGIYVWGENIWKAKIYNEAIDYLLGLALKMKQFGIKPDSPIGSEKGQVDPKIYD